MLGWSQGSGLHCDKRKRRTLNAQRLTSNLGWRTPKAELERQRAKGKGRKAKGKRKRPTPKAFGAVHKQALNPEKIRSRPAAGVQCLMSNVELEGRSVIAF